MATTTTEKIFDCVLVGDRHHGLTEGVRCLLETMSKTFVMVADVPSLQTSAGLTSMGHFVVRVPLQATD